MTAVYLGYKAIAYAQVAEKRMAWWQGQEEAPNVVRGPYNDLTVCRAPCMGIDGIQAGPLPWSEQPVLGQKRPEEVVARVD